jgi:hypothetical protein
MTENDGGPVCHDCVQIIDLLRKRLCWWRVRRAAIAAPVVPNYLMLFETARNPNHSGCPIYGTVDQNNLQISIVPNTPIDG